MFSVYAYGELVMEIEAEDEAEACAMVALQTGIPFGDLSAQ